mmetsp:Transcript_10293/g.23215  ORF Transcript_10293/g.23215 Transcript_10293/m.23215 type:complete len:254 (+) Transcript_10293:344-1105(+)
MDRVALPLPFFCWTTSVPASCTLASSLGTSEAEISLPAGSWEKRGRIVLPAWPPITGTWAGFPVISSTNLLARTTSNVEMPTIFRGSRPFFFQSSHMAGTTEFTGLTMSPTTALGQCFATASTFCLAMPALTLSRSLRSWPGLRGMPAGMRTRWHPLSTSAALSMALSSWMLSTSGVTLHLPSMWERSAATPLAGTIAMLRSMMTSSLTRGHVAMSNDRGCPMPPAPPMTQTLKSPAGSFFMKLKQLMMPAPE